MPKISIDFSQFYSLMNKAFWEFFTDRNRVRISFGGSGSGKSVQAFQEIIYKVLVEPGHNYLICRKVAATNRVSTYALLQQLISQMNLTEIFSVNKTDQSFTVKSSGYMIILKGLDDVEKVKSLTFPKGILTDIVIEEASEINQSDFNQLNARLRGVRVGEQKDVPFQITMLLNPININHWIYTEFFQKKSYQKTFPVTILKTTYKDNKFIDEDYKAVLEGYKEIDEQFYRVYCLGEWGSYGNVIFNNYSFEPINYVDEDFDSVYPGADFGFIHPSVIVKTGFKDEVMYSYSELCVFEKTNKEFIDLNNEFNILQKGKQCIGDSAEPDRIKEWVQAGYGMIGAKKGKGSVSRGIDFIKSQRWIIDPDKCPRLAQEVQQYHWKKGKNDEILDEPVDLFDDAIKATMYGLEPLSGMKSAPLVLSGSKSDEKKGIIEIKREERRKKREVLKAQARQKRLELKK
jgi:phage terminase large subunit